jgi:hypothetical protein
MTSRFSGFFVATLFVAVLDTTGMAQAPVLSIEGDRFRVNGQERFLLFVSYFDAMRRAGSTPPDANGFPSGDPLGADFSYFRRHGIDGIRILPNWWRWSCPKSPSPDDALFTVDGALRPATDVIWKRFLYVLNKAAEHGLLVDVTFTAETLKDIQLGEPGGPTLAGYGSQIAGVARRLKNAHPHVFLDVHNEYTNNGVQHDELLSIVADVRNEADGDGDAARLLTASATDPGEAGAAARLAALDIAATHAIHLDANDVWFRDATVAAAIAATRSALAPAAARPIHLQEPKAFAAACGDEKANDFDGTPGHYRMAVASAKRQGAAALTFHTRTTFDLASTAFVDKASAVEKQELEALRAAADAEPAWGTPRKTR